MGVRLSFAARPAASNTPVGLLDPVSGTAYIGLQNHDPGDVVYFKEVSVRPLDDAP
jgi:hypothetical protein